MGNQADKWLSESGVQRRGRTYRSGDEFLEDMRNGRLMEGFFLDESTFQEIVEMVNFDENIAKEVNDNAIVIAIKADKGMELGGILELAEVVANGR